MGKARLISSKYARHEAGVILSVVFRNDIRPRLLRYVMSSKKPAYISKVARELNMNKRTVLINFSALEEAGLVKSEWKVINGRGKPALVKSFAPTSELTSPRMRIALY
jgi:predicted transcriptional regulator